MAASNKFANHFLMKFISNHSKLDSDSKIEPANDYTVENTDHTSNNLLNMLTPTKHPEPLIIPKSNILSHLEKRHNRKDKLKVKTTNTSVNLNKEKSLLQKNAFSPKSNNRDIAKVTIGKNYYTDKPDLISKAINQNEIAEKIVLKSSSKLTFSPQSTTKKFKVSNNSLFSINNNQNKGPKNPPDKKKSINIDYTKIPPLSGNSKKPSKEETKKSINKYSVNTNTNSSNAIKKNNNLVESRKQFNKNFNQMKQKLSQNDLDTEILPKSPNQSGYNNQDTKGRPKSENKIKSPTKISLYKPSNSKVVKGKNTTNTMYFSSSPNKIPDGPSSGPQSPINSQTNSIGNLNSEVISSGQSLLVKNDFSNDEKNVFQANKYGNQNYLRAEAFKPPYESTPLENNINIDVETISSNNARECFIKNKYKLLVDNFNKPGSPQTVDL